MHLLGVSDRQASILLSSSPEDDGDTALLEIAILCGRWENPRFNVFNNLEGVYGVER